MAPYAVLDGPGEVYCSAVDSPAGLGVVQPRGEPQPTRDLIVIRAEAGKKVTGSLYVVKPDLTGMVRLRFEIPAAAADKDAQQAFSLEVKQSHYQRLLDHEIPGGAWFRHEERQTQAALHQNPTDTPAITARNRGRRRQSELDAPANCSAAAGR